MALDRATLAAARRLVRAVGDEADDATRDMTRAWLLAWRTLAPTWRQVILAIISARRAGQHPTKWTLASNQQVRRALHYTYVTTDDLARRAEAITTAAAVRSISFTAEQYPLVMALQLPESLRDEYLVRFTGAPPPGALGQMIDRTRQTIHAVHRPLSEYAVQAIKQQLILGIASGRHNNASAAAMVRIVRDALDLPLTRAVNIARTEVLDAYRRAGALFDAANSDVLAGWRWHATLDRRTCPSCWSKHGTLYSLDTPGPWDHQQGRCARVPELRSWSELGIGGREPQSALPDARAVFAGLSDADKLAVMGPARLALLTSGAVRWEDLSIRRPVDGWRDSFASRTVSDLTNLQV